MKVTIFLLLLVIIGLMFIVIKEQHTVLTDIYNCKQYAIKNKYVFYSLDENNQCILRKFKGKVIIKSIDVKKLIK